MMVMVWYVLFLYPTYFGLEPVADFGGYETAFLSANIWLFTSFILFYTGYPILRGAFVSLRAGRPNMDLLVATAALGSYGYSAVAVLLGHSHLYFDVTVAIVLVVTAGTHYEKSVKRRATGLLAELTERQVDEARLESGETVPLEAIEPGDRLLVRPGERVPLDGEIREGSAAVDESLITGESLPVGKGRVISSAAAPSSPTPRSSSRSATRPRALSIGSSPCSGRFRVRGRASSGSLTNSRPSSFRWWSSSPSGRPPSRSRPARARRRRCCSG